MAKEITLVFVHGWSVTTLDTYGQLPIRLREEGKLAGIDITVKDIYLGQYISFHDEVRLQDISRAFQAAVNDILSGIISAGGRFIAITHSTGGPVMRDWWNRYKSKWTYCPMSRLIMLAPANFGSALSQLGKSKVSRLKSWWSDGVEPGQNVLNWLELGSIESWELNTAWINSDPADINPNTYFPFALIGQTIDRKLYDHLNSYTGELGSDGVVRSAAANLNATCIYLRQHLNSAGNPDPKIIEAPTTAFRIVRHASHSDDRIGVMDSEKATPGDPTGADTVKSIIKCIHVNTRADYDQVCTDFANETADVQREEQVEKTEAGFFSLSDRYYIHDRFSMVIFRVCDSEGYPVTDYDLIFTGPGDNPNLMPEGFFADRQCNSRNRETVTYFVNYDIMIGSDPVIADGKEIRGKTVGLDTIGIRIEPRPQDGFVRYANLTLNADRTFLGKFIKPNATTLIDICLERIVDTAVFEILGPIETMPANGDFSTITPTGNNAA